MIETKKNTVLGILIFFVAIFIVLILAENTGNPITGSAAENPENFASSGLTAKTVVIYVLGVIVFILLFVYLVILHKQRKNDSQ